MASRGWLAALVEGLEKRSAAGAVPPELATAACQELGRLRRLVSERAGVNDAASLRALETLVGRRPEIVEHALEALGGARLRGRLREYVDAYPAGDRDDQGLALLIELDRGLLAATIGNQMRRRLSAGGRRALRSLQRELEAASRLVRERPWPFARWSRAIAAYCEDHGVGDDHPFTAVLESASDEIPVLVAAWQARRDAAMAARNAEICEARATKARSANRTGDAIRWLVEALRLVPGRVSAVAALRAVLSAAGRAVEFDVADSSLAVAGAQAAGVERPPIALRRREAGAEVTLAETAEGDLVAIVEKQGRGVEGTAVTLLEILGEGRRAERAAGVTDREGRVSLGPARRLAPLLGAGPGHVSMEVILPPGHRSRGT